MSGSGASTPRGAMTPPPSGEGPSPLAIGTRFVKQYYKVLSTTPEHIHKFYQPSSVLSHGVGSEPTQPIVFETLPNETLKTRFQQQGYEDSPIRFEFEHGAIDAQISVNGGVLLVVTGHIVYLGNTASAAAAAADEDGGNQNQDQNQEEVRRKAFVHTFFLGSLSAGTKRSYYVHNDVLRFLHDTDEEKTVVASNTTTSAVETPAVQMPTVDEPPTEVFSTQTAAPDDQDEAPGGGVEETKEPMPDEELEEKATSRENIIESEQVVVPELGVVVEDIKKAVLKSTVLEETPEKTKPTSDSKLAQGSWASLVAGSGGSAPATPTVGSPVRPASKPKPKPSPAPPPKLAPQQAPEGRADASRSRPTGKRDPDCTLVIKNINSSTTEPDVLGMFEPFAKQTDAKIVGLTVSAHKGIAFVDYDSAAPVLAAVEAHQKEPMQLRGRTLDMYQKTLEQRGRRSQGGRGGFRGGQQPGNGNAYRGGSGGGGSGRQYRRSSSGGAGGGRGDGRGGRSGRGAR